MATGLEVGGVEYISILRPRPRELIPNSGQARAEVLAVLQSIGVIIKRQPLDSGPHNPGLRGSNVQAIESVRTTLTITRTECAGRPYPCDVGYYIGMFA